MSRERLGELETGKRQRTYEVHPREKTGKDLEVVIFVMVWRWGTGLTHCT